MCQTTQPHLVNHFNTKLSQCEKSESVMSYNVRQEEKTANQSDTK